MNIPQNSHIRLFSNVPRDYIPACKNREEQEEYFSGKEVFSSWTKVNKFSYLRLGQPVKVGLPINELMKADYMIISNPDFENIKWFLFIDDIEYVNNKTTRISYTVDSWQTGIYDAYVGSCKIIREHLSYADKLKALNNPWDQSIYEHLTDEGLATGRMMEPVYGLNDTAMVPTYDPDDELAISADKGAMLWISDFDTERFPNIMEDFYKLFNVVYSSDGRLIYSTITDIDTDMDIVRIPRGYGIYYLTLDDTGMTRLKTAINWLTIQGLNEQILYPFQITKGQFALFIYMASKNISERYIYTTKLFPKINTNLDSEKLYTSPFAYIRAYNDDGSCKEYKWEKFNTMILGDVKDKSANFYYFPIFDTFPMSSLMPGEYDAVNKEVVNYEERIDNFNFPQISYTTDAFLSYIASQHTSAIASRSNTVGESIQSAIDRGMNDAYDYAFSGDDGKALNTAMGAFGSAGRAALSPVTNAVKGITSAESPLQAAGSLVNSVSNAQLSYQRNETAVWRSHPVYESSVFGPKKDAYVADEYHAASSNGILGEYLITPRPAGSFKLVSVRLRDEILEVYDNFFRRFGYTSNRIGVPRIVNYFHGKTDNKDIPYFSPLDDKRVTYVKTSNAHVDHNIKIIRDGIKAVLDGGALFLQVKGATDAET